MRRINFVTYVHGPTSEEFGSAEILECSDINALVEQKLQLLNATITRLEQENQELKRRIANIEEDIKVQKEYLWGEISTIKLFLVGKKDRAALKIMESCIVNGATVMKTCDEAQKTRAILDKLPEASRQIFAEVMKEVLAPKLEMFARQIKAQEELISRIEKNQTNPAS